MARDGRLDELAKIKKKVESLAGRLISERQLIEALDHPDLIEAIGVLPAAMHEMRKRMLYHRLT